MGNPYWGRWSSNGGDAPYKGTHRASIYDPTSRMYGVWEKQRNMIDREDWMRQMFGEDWRINGRVVPSQRREL